MGGGGVKTPSIGGTVTGYYNIWRHMYGGGGGGVYS